MLGVKPPHPIQSANRRFKFPGLGKIENERGTRYAVTSKMTEQTATFQATADADCWQEPYRGPCVECGDPILADDLCTECYWNHDQDLKKKRRANPEWRFKRAFSFAITCLGMKEEEALLYALKSVDKLLDELEKKKKVE